MARETVGYVKLEWTCPNCGSRNPGPAKTCNSCGAAQPEDVHFEQAARQELLEDEKEVARAEEGPDIHCAYCGARNRATAENCSQCGADITEGRARVSGRVVGAHRDEPVAEVPCPSCGAPNPANALECSQCGASMTRPKIAPRRVTTPQQISCGPIVGILIAGAFILFGVFAFFSLRTASADGRVQDVSWTRSIVLEALQPVTREAWRDDVPAEGKIRVCSQQVHHVQDSPTMNSNKVCGTPYTVDTGSGYGEVVQDCQFEVYEDWCEYTIQAWQRIDVLAVEGQGFEPRWPAANPGDGQRLGEQEESYKVLFDVDGEIHTYRTSDLQEFLRYQVGSRWNLEINAMGAVVDVGPAE
jgi:ribosomal protein L40E